MKLFTVIGARPQFIKAAVVSRAIAEIEQSRVKNHKASIQEVLIHTGQHYDANMSDVFFEELSIPKPNYNLGIGGGTHGQNTGRMVESIEKVLKVEQPNWVLVYGDTDSTLAAAIAAVKLHIPIAHVEAGLRSYNRRMPEEVNRVLTDHCSDVLFTPTDTASKNLKIEGISGEKVQQVGDVMYDATILFKKIATDKSRVLDRVRQSPGDFVLLTVHRAENSDDAERMKNILAGIGQSSRQIIWPIHPRTLKRINEFGLKIPENIMMIEPVGYLDMVMLESSAALIVTDSGGVQKEAYFHQVPCITLREETEWGETVHAGWNQLVGANRELIINAFSKCEKPQLNCNFQFGDGRSAHKIVQFLRR